MYLNDIPIPSTLNILVQRNFKRTNRYEKRFSRGFMYRIFSPWNWKYCLSLSNVIYVCKTSFDEACGKYFFERAQQWTQGLHCSFWFIKTRTPLLYLFRDLHTLFFKAYLWMKISVSFMRKREILFYLKEFCNSGSSKHM